MKLSKINRLIARGLYIDAIELCESAIKSMPEFYVYYEQLAHAQVAVGDLVSAQTAVKQGLLIKPSSPILLKIEQDIANLENGYHQFCFVGRYNRLPDSTGARSLEGGVRLSKFYKRPQSCTPLVSIITVVYNNPNSLEKCIQSVATQTYENIEHILIDGGSEKPTINVIKKHDSHFDYYVSEPDLGIYDAMNKGIQVARGEYIAILNSDDQYDPDFVLKSLEIAKSKQADITYCNYYSGRTEHIASQINDGVLLGHLNICHNTFLVSKECYNRIGPYNSKLRIISDAIWIRKAFSRGERFCHVDESLFTLTEGGLSSGSTQENRSLFISEVAKSYILQFPFLTQQEAEELYLFRFNNKRLKMLLAMARKYKSHKIFFNSLRLYIEYCFKSRDNFILTHTESNNLFLEYMKACDLLGVDKRTLRINTKHGCLSKFLEGLQVTINKRRQDKSLTILHFVSVFSTPSETFIYDLLCRLDKDQKYDNFILYEHKKLEKERPFNKKLYVPWNDFRPEVRNFIYRFIFENVNPNIVIAHFAINEWKLYQRIQPLGISVPTLTMTHGIDVFMLKSDESYREYILNDFCKRGKTKFTTVSNYLMGELIGNGVEPKMITQIYNTANQRFFDHRKISDFYNYQRTLKILSVGRCIDWKGHIELLEGFRWFLDTKNIDADLTIVYGNGDSNLDEVKEAIIRLELTANTKLIPFVNFAKEPDYFSSFDIYIQASKYSVDGLHKSETFGVAALEAILSGLPVIVTDAGGLPEVIGQNGVFSQIVEHGKGVELGKAIKRFHDRPETFSDNYDYAKQLFDFFSEQKQIQAISKEIHKLTFQKPKVAIFSTSTTQGAGYAAFRLFKGLRDASNVEPKLFTTVRNHENEHGINVVKHPSGHGKGWAVLQNPENSHPGLTIFTMNHPCLSNDQLYEIVKGFDAISIHWVARFLSLENIAFLSNIGVPIIMTIRDMQPITGGCHYFHGCDSWMGLCKSCPQLIDSYNDFPSKVIQAKRNTYNFNNLTLVTLSNHSKNILSKAPIFKDCRIEVIPNSIEIDVFTPTNKKEARVLLDLPPDRKIIAYVPSFSSEVKGYKQLIQAFDKICTLYNDDEAPLVLLVGNKTPANDLIGLDSISLGYIADNEKLALAYSAADVVAVPSLEETFSNTTAEAISCGTPVVGFKTGAIPDIVVDGVSGYSYEIGDTDGLAYGIFSVLSNPLDTTECRKIAVDYLEFSLQARRYEELILDLINNPNDFSSSSLKEDKYELELYQPLINQLTSKLLQIQ